MYPPLNEDEMVSDKFNVPNGTLGVILVSY
jgi:hypothetical protein